MDRTGEIKEAIVQYTDTVLDELDKIKSRTSQVEEKMQDAARRQSTENVFGTTTDSNLKKSVSQALQTNQQTLTNFINGGVKGGISIEVKDMSLANLTGGTASLNTDTLGIVGSVSRFSHVRDVLPKISMTTGTLPIIKDNGATGTFTPVAEGGTKPVIDFNLAEQAAKAEVIAAIVNVTRQFLDDLGAQGVTSWLTNRLTELYLMAEDDQFLNGSGVSPNLAGVNLAGNFTAATSLAADNDVVQLVKTIIQMRALGRTPTVIIIHPTDLTRVLLNTASGSGEFDLPSYVSVNAQGGLSILNVPIVDTQAQVLGQFNVLNTNQMIMGVRENLRIQFFEQDGSNVRTNRITVRAESRIAFATYGAANNIKGTF